MYVVSCRRDFDSPQWFSAANQLRNYTNPKNPKAWKEARFEDLCAAAEGKHVLLLVHGFRNPMDNVIQSYWELTAGLEKAGLNTYPNYGLIVGFAWPGFQTAPGFFPAVGNANRSAGYLRQIARELKRYAHSIDVQAHSLGARVALQSINAGDELYLENLLLIAPAVDNHALLPHREFSSALDNCLRCCVYHSRFDRTLKFAYRLGDIFTGFDKALGLDGPADKKRTIEECPNVFVIDASGAVKSHGGYRKAPKYFAHWKQVLNGPALPRYDEL
jgi:esterase/lipase superfamily enzyme